MPFFGKAIIINLLQGNCGDSDGGGGDGCDGGTKGTFVNILHIVSLLKPKDHSFIIIKISSDEWRRWRQRRIGKIQKVIGHFLSLSLSILCIRCKVALCTFLQMRRFAATLNLNTLSLSRSTLDFYLVLLVKTKTFHGAVFESCIYNLMYI